MITYIVETFKNSIQYSCSNLEDLNRRDFVIRHVLRQFAVQTLYQMEVGQMTKKKKPPTYL